MVQAGGAHARRVACYTTVPGASAEDCAAELELLRSGRVHALALTSTAEVCRKRIRSLCYQYNVPDLESCKSGRIAFWALQAMY